MCILCLVMLTVTLDMSDNMWSRSQMVHKTIKQYIAKIF